MGIGALSGPEGWAEGEGAACPPAVLVTDNNPEAPRVWDGQRGLAGPVYPWGAGTNPVSRPRGSPGGVREWKSRAAALLWVLLGTAAPSPGRIPSPRIFPMDFFSPPLICFEVTCGRSCPLHRPFCHLLCPSPDPSPSPPLSIQAAPPLFPIQRNDPVPFPASQKSAGTSDPSPLPSQLREFHPPSWGREFGRGMWGMRTRRGRNEERPYLSRQR